MTTHQLHLRQWRRLYQEPLELQVHDTECQP